MVLDRQKKPGCPCRGSLCHLLLLPAFHAPAPAFSKTQARRFGPG
jgi:hypothetical protein